jgi:hypothetical protein
MEIPVDQPFATSHASDPQLHLLRPELVHGTHIWHLLPDVCHLQRYALSLSTVSSFSRKTSSELFTHAYGFGIGTSGLAYLGLGVGFVIAAVFGARFSDKVYAHYRAQHNGVGKPEMRIPALIIGSLFIPIGLLYVGRLYLSPWQLFTTFVVGMDGLLRLGSIGLCPLLVLGSSASAL